MVLTVGVDRDIVKSWLKGSLLAGLWALMKGDGGRTFGRRGDVDGSRGFFCVDGASFLFECRGGFRGGLEEVYDGGAAAVVFTVLWDGGS